MSNSKQRKVQRKKRKKRKMRYLRQRLARTNDSAQRRRLIAKIHRLSPRASIPES